MLLKAVSNALALENFRDRTRKRDPVRRLKSERDGISHTRYVSPLFVELLAVVNATMVSMPSLISAAAVTLLGMVTNVLIKFRKIWIFVTGIIYIIAGILTFTCLVLYITYVIQELEHKHDEKDEAGDKIFSHRYGYSIIFAMISFCTQELGGISLIYYAIYRFKQHWEQKDRQFAERSREIQLNEIRFPSASFHLERAAPFMADSNHRSYYTSLEQIERLPLHSVHSRWDGSLPPGQRSVPNCSPKLHRKSMTVPDLDVRTRDVYIGNHLNCSYNSTYRTPFGLDVSRAPSGNRGVPNPRGRLPRQVTFSDDELDVIRVEGGVQFSRHHYLPELVYAQPVRRQRPLRTASLRMTPV